MLRFVDSSDAQASDYVKVWSGLNPARLPGPTIEASRRANATAIAAMWGGVAFRRH